VLTARAEVTDRMLIFGQRHLQTILAQYAAHYNGRRPFTGDEQAAVCAGWRASAGRRASAALCVLCLVHVVAKDECLR
jgi:hypothetical protein